MKRKELIEEIERLGKALNDMEERYDLATEQLSNSSAYGYSQLMEDLEERGLMEETDND